MWRADTACTATRMVVSERALFVIDAEGKVHWSFVFTDRSESRCRRNSFSVGGFAKQTSDASNDLGKMISQTQLKLPDPERRSHSRARSTRRLRYWSMEITNASFAGEVQPIVREIQRRLGDDLCFAFRHFPLTNVHPHAEHAAEAAEGAGRTGSFLADARNAVRQPGCARRRVAGGIRSRAGPQRKASDFRR